MTLALPGPRHAVARWLGFESVRIEPGVTVPTTAPATTAPLASTSVSVPGPTPELGLGPDVSIDAAMSRTGLPDPAPTLLGEPLSIHVVRPPESGQIVTVYAPSDLLPQSDVTGVGALVSVLPVQIEEGFFRKTLGDTATVRPVSSDEVDGYWIEGSPHQLMFSYGDDVLDDTLRLATNTLLWQRDGHVYRLEADISLETALRIAKTVPVTACGVFHAHVGASRHSTGLRSGGTVWRAVVSGVHVDPEATRSDRAHLAPDIVWRRGSVSLRGADTERADGGLRQRRRTHRRRSRNHRSPPKD